MAEDVQPVVKPPVPTPIVTVQEMKTSAGTVKRDKIGDADRTVTPHVFKQRWKAEYEVDHWKWIFGQRETQPDIMNYGPERRQ
jgi:hypothetical protein